MPLHLHHRASARLLALCELRREAAQRWFDELAGSEARSAGADHDDVIDE